MNGVRVRLHDFQCLDAVLCHEHSVAGARQISLDGVASLLFVFDEQDRLGRRTRVDEGWCLRRRRDSLAPRQKYLEGCSKTWFAIYPDLASGLSDNAMHRGQAKPGALSHAF